ncbi:polysaccharide lyase [Billgrantia montanilacus]|uniref:Polysaccharide lyase 14 domain-containing protein n=1 Tax=Billgrantia montanilacus TaxID=2282305 RepID=A0A368U4E8_9GAMM|nr:hypothetical protein [Halomonas montanilacus]RCV91905.1 hypothetical protein DU505_02225 [Halomonas montanilacus]
MQLIESHRENTDGLAGCRPDGRYPRASTLVKRIAEALARGALDRRKLWLTLGLATSVGVAATEASAGNRDTSTSLTPCSKRYSLAASPRPLRHQETAKASIRDDFGSERDWGTENNVKLLTIHATGLGETGFRVLYPEGSSSPSDADQDGVARGGMGFYTREAALEDDDRACLHYRVRFEPEFDFVKGGKLPGLYGAEAPSGGDEVDGENGFSMRLMWREEGQGELYPYIMDHEGESMGRGAWTFPKGRWISVEQEVILNTPGKDDGIARVWIDGRPTLERKGLAYRTTEDVAIDGLMFSTFFGGTGEGWRTPRDQTVDFAAFRIYAP